MSFFYLSPVKGFLPIHLLESIVHGRLIYLKSCLNGEPANYNEYIVEGSVYDNVGHFTICIVALFSKSTTFTQFLLNAETELFKRRFEALSNYDIRCFAKKILKFIKRYDALSIPALHEVLKIMCQYLNIKELAQHINANHKQDCNAHHISLHFKHCLWFVAKRQVELKNGFAFLPCSKWKQYLVSLFKSHLRDRLRYTNLDPLFADPRIISLSYKLKNELKELTSYSSDHLLRSDDVDTSAKFFPPCMLNLHQALRKRHRLSHSQRFYYSLFLKDIGMPIEEAIKFWQKEYRQSPNGVNTCGHNWETDEKRYIYGIRHMYGFEGARKNYTSVCCQKIQSNECSSSEGGCPFKHFDQINMIQLLNIKNEELVTQINDLRKKQKYTTACLMYLKTNFTQNSTQCITGINFTPVKYYCLTSKCIL